MMFNLMRMDFKRLFKTEIALILFLELQQPLLFWQWSQW